MLLARGNKTRLEPAAARAVLEAATESRTGSAIAYLGSILFEDDELVLCLFDAPSRAAVRRTSERAGIPCERVMDSHWLPPRPPPTTHTARRCLMSTRNWSFAAPPDTHPLHPMVTHLPR